MIEDVVEHWLHTGKNAVIGRFSFKPIEHKYMKGKPLSVKKGQSDVYFLASDKGQLLLLKKFHNNQNLDKSYLGKVQSLLPRHEGFICGTEREILSKGALNKSVGFHYSKEFDNWLDGTILMPKVNGYDWSNLADDLRDNSVTLDMKQRLTISLKFTELIKYLEDSQCCHRDLSCGNVFIDIDNWTVFLIDFDSLFHPSLIMPVATTFGTAGYISHLAWTDDQVNAIKTWCPYADRYAMAILNAEILLVNPNIKATNDGGIFEQQELRSQSGKILNSILKTLNSTFPKAAEMLEAVIKSSSFADCPSPQDWLDFYETIPGFIIRPPSLSDMPEISSRQFREILTKPKKISLWTPPSLDELSAVKIGLPPKITIPSVTLPRINFLKKAKTRTGE